MHVVDPEAAWQFLKRRIFDVEGIELIQRPFSTFKDMVFSLYEAEKLGACCWIVDPLTLIWNELLDSFKQKLGYIPIDKWQDVRQLWNDDYIRYFLNCSMNCLALGRLGNDFEEREETLKNGETKTKLVKVGTKFKAGELTGQETEPHKIIYFKLYKSQIPVIEQALETAALMLGTDKSRGYCLEMICADFLAGANLENGNPEILLQSIMRFFKFLPSQERQTFVQRVVTQAS